ncbi:MAG: hypothetical protein E7403_04795 [Ruminococcaceae bacterium]|nr:hypothetical protein [Oscillospiraceae bacterium]
MNKLIWLFENLDKYQYNNETSRALKEQYARLLITEETLETEVIRNEAEEIYNAFVENFYNDILSYHNGLSDKSITSEWLDCYFLQTSDGYVPIGFYKEMRPAETSIMVQDYIESCKENVKKEKNKVIIKWQEKIGTISALYHKIKDSKSPSAARGAFGLVLSVLLLFLYVAVIVWLLNNSTYITLFLNQFLRLAGFGLGIAAVIFPLVCSIQELILFSEKKKTKNLLENIRSIVQNVEKTITENVQNQGAVCAEGARKGNNVCVVQHSVVSFMASVSHRMDNANKFVQKSEKKRRKVGRSTVVCLLISAFILGLMLLFSFVNIGEMLAFDMPTETQTTAEPSLSPKATMTSSPTATPTPAVTETPVPSPTPRLLPTAFFVSDIVRYTGLSNASGHRPVASPAYNKHLDSLFNFEIDYPSHFVRVENDSSFVSQYMSSDGAACLNIIAAGNGGNIKPSDIDGYLKTLYSGEVSYNPVEDTWFALSCGDDSTVHYAYYKVSDGIIKGFEFHFADPIHLENYSKYIDHIYSSFKNLS